MTVFKKLFTATLIVLIILSIAGIIYVVQFQEELPEKEQAALYRIAQEALNNITRHADVCTALVRLCLENRTTRRGV